MLKHSSPPSVWPAWLSLQKKTAYLSRIHLPEGVEFSAFQTNAAATFLVGTLRISPLGILDYNDMLDWLSDTAARRTGKNKVRSHDNIHSCKNGIRSDVAQHADVNVRAHEHAL